VADELEDIFPLEDAGFAAGLLAGFNVAQLVAVSSMIAINK
jgi:hypothetical protein